jgi:hypothetical protein
MVEGLIAEGKPLKVALEAVGMAKSSYYYRSKGGNRAPLMELWLRQFMKFDRAMPKFTATERLQWPSGLMSGQLTLRRYYDIFVPWD